MTQEKKRIGTQFCEIAYTERGEGPVALFVRGVFPNSYLWRHVVARVADLRRGIAVDLMSHGDNPAGEPLDISFGAQGAMPEAFCQSLRLESVDLVANDSGGAIAQIFAARHRKGIRSLTTTNCDVHDNDPPPAFAPTQAAAAPRVFSARRKELLGDMETVRPAFGTGYEHVERCNGNPAHVSRAALGHAAGDAQSGAMADRFARLQPDGGDRATVAPTPSAHADRVWGTADVFFPVKCAYWRKDTGLPARRR
jgi:pimeloyl-ACP methyl ester carboxylesterase